MSGTKLSNPAGDQLLLDLVERGIFHIDGDGSIWRRYFRRHGKYYPCDEHRAENGIGSGRYLQVALFIDGKNHYVSAHRVVYRWYYGKDIPEGMEINHKNGHKYDNRPENLEVVTTSENLKHAFRIGALNQWGENNHQSKLSSDDIIKIRQMYASGKYTQIEISKVFGIKFQSVSKIVKGHSRRKEGGPIVVEDCRSSLEIIRALNGQVTGVIRNKAPKTSKDGIDYSLQKPADIFSRGARI